MTPLSFGTILISLVLLGAAADDTQPRVICSGQAAGGYAAFPDICRLKNGDLYCVFYSGYAHIAVPNKEWPKGGRVMAIRSGDQGNTWSEPVLIMDTDGDDRDPSVACLQDGTLFLNWFTLSPDWFPVRLDPKKVGKDQVATLFACSKDNGKTWSKPKRLTTDSKYWFACSSPVRELPEGSLVLGLNYAEYPPGIAFGATIKSFDGGNTWKDLALIEKPGLYLDGETDVIPLKDGRLFAALRSSQSPMHFATSTDWGKTWSPVHPIGFAGHCPYLHRTVDGIVVLGYRKVRVTGKGHQAAGTALRYSVDECKTWSDEIAVDTVAVGAYPSMVSLRDGSVLIVYYEEGGGSGIRARRFRISCSGIEWLPP